MKKYNVAIVGSGFRACIFIRLIKSLENDFVLTNVLCRTDIKKEYIKSNFDVPCTISRADILKSKPDFIINAVSKENIYSETIYYLSKNIPVLQETGGVLSTVRLKNLYDRVNNGDKLLIAEQYHLYPLVQAYKRIIDSKILGDIRYVKVSYSHDYHSLNVIKYLLDEKDVLNVTGNKHNFLITKTDSREGLCYSGELQEAIVTNFTFGFPNGKIGYHNFNSMSFRSTILNRNIEVVGSRGTILGEDIKYLDENNKTISKQLLVSKDKIYFGDELLYENKLLNILSLEETVLSGLLYEMVELIKYDNKKQRVISALKDAYTANVINKISDKQIYSMININDIFK
ncbi:MAG: hypothetical protein LBV51_03315 [Acholeplasmatales bacterium]|jgi:predicted dehydrogenase|nr:hypothetical protein [Acholeplasmatales bacterium]